MQSPLDSSFAGKSGSPGFPARETEVRETARVRIPGFRQKGESAPLRLFLYGRKTAKH
ncbi:hypothetical protein OBV_37580 [Oscillibacter valericigenes Sjm18-20]|nr:hypothetical protein OBV_37580 [Oscillibacter valericigenes Sjm18-20]